MTGVAILGMHRGGTSAFAGVVHKLGAYMNEYHMLQPSVHNPRGYFEDDRFVAIHNRFMGGNWYTPPGDQIFFSMSMMADYEAIIREYQAYDLWMVKDPRLCYCLPRLLEVTDDIKIIAIHRDPWYAAKSLAKRSGIPIVESLEISTRFLNKMYKNVGSFDSNRVFWARYIDLVTAQRYTVKEIANFIGIPSNDDAELFPDVRLAHGELADLRGLEIPLATYTIKEER